MTRTHEEIAAELESQIGYSAKWKSFRPLILAALREVAATQDRRWHEAFAVMLPLDRREEFLRAAAILSPEDHGNAFRSAARAEWKAAADAERLICLEVAAEEMKRVQAEARQEEREALRVRLAEAVGEVRWPAAHERELLAWLDARSRVEEQR